MKKNGKLTLALLVVIGMMTIGVVAFAAEALSPVDIVSQLTGKTVEELREVRAAGKTYGTVAKEAGVLDAFKNAMLESKKLILAERVASGDMTQAEADAAYAAIVAAQENCDGTGTAKIGKELGIGFGQGSGLRDGTGMGTGKGRGQGQGLMDGSGSSRGGMGRGRNRLNEM
jgi:hypothetical protein